MLKIWPVPVLSDNYVWVLQRSGVPLVAVVDPGQAEPVAAALADRGLQISAVLLTHHHGDHVGGVSGLIGERDLPVYGPAGETITCLNHPQSEGSVIMLEALEIELEVVEVPGHTRGHVAYRGPEFALVGDTLFAGGCGRVFEGTMEQMHSSLQRLADLPATTAAYCAHEYTLANLRFATAVEPENQALAERMVEAKAIRDAVEPTVPSTLALELATNPFLRCSEPSVVEAASRNAGRDVAPGADTFSVIRRWKDSLLTGAPFRAVNDHGRQAM